MFPPQRPFFWAVLRVLHVASEPMTRERVHESVADALRLTPEQRAERLQNLDTNLRYRHRSGWSLSMLKAGGYVANPERGAWTITHKGREVLFACAGDLDDVTYRRMLAASRGSETSGASEPAPISESQRSPEERIEEAAAEIVSALSRELLEPVTSASPASSNSSFSICCAPWGTALPSTISSAPAGRAMAGSTA